MAQRLPQMPQYRPHPESGHAVLEQEILAEKAATLGRLGKKVAAGIAQLAALGDVDEDTREDRLLEVAADVHAFFIQRELCGLRDQRQVIADYAIPPAVLVRLGSRPKAR